MAFGAVGKVAIDFIGRTGELEKTVGKVRASLGGLQDQIIRGQGGIGGPGGVTLLSDMSEGFGKVDKATAKAAMTLKDFMKILKGGGMIAGIGLAANMFRHWAGEIEEVATKMRETGSSSGDMGRELIRTIPVFGAVVKGFDSISEAITGEKSFVKSIEDASAALDAMYDKFLKTNNKLTLMNLSGPTKDIKSAMFDRDAELAAISASAKAAREKARIGIDTPSAGRTYLTAAYRERVRMVETEIAGIDKIEKEHSQGVKDVFSKIQADIQKGLDVEAAAKRFDAGLRGMRAMFGLASHDAEIWARRQVGAVQLVLGASKELDKDILKRRAAEMSMAAAVVDDFLDQKTIAEGLNLPEALTRGSAGAVSAINRASASPTEKTAQKTMEEILKTNRAQAAEQKRLTDIAAEMVRNMETVGLN